jgi:membrane protein
MPLKRGKVAELCRGAIIAARLYYIFRMKLPLLQSLGKLRAVRVLLDALQGYDRHHCLYMSAAISFYAMIALGPLTYLGLVALQGFIGSSGVAQAQLLATLQGFMLPDAASHLVARVSQASLLSSLGTWWALLALTWSGISFYEALSGIFTQAWGGGRKRQFLISKLRAIIAFAAAGLFFVITMWLTGGITFVEGLGDRYLGMDLSDLWRFIAWASPYLLSIVIFFLLYRFLPNAQVSWRLALYIAVPVGILWELSKRIFVYWGGGFADQFYGPLAWFILLMVWIYWSSNIVLLGAEIGAAWQRSEEGFEAEEVQKEGATP